ncbi:fumarylacetoacetate hydrolase family protein [Caulobacter sp. S45]|uniref:fumarylacetoacetate hydrolase family protein n=1 Tax=Caulobacter sp. S45 TaxID=1641861 RepID=UPI00131DDCA8|nr:fumarylacetoacetate hydrolase family protein [Caulobacter sp. S45]
MKFATFDDDGREQVGWIEDDHTVHPIAAADMVDLITRYDELGPSLQARGVGVALDGVRLVAPIPRPRRNIFCVGKNYRDHAQEFSRSGYDGPAKDGDNNDYPAVFTKPASCVVGTGAAVQTHPSVTSEVDYEGELAVVIGRPGIDIARSDAMAHVWGYTIVNDVTARDRQKRHRQWFLGKALDTFCPMGPWITTADEVVAVDLLLQTWVNGELRQNANTRDLIFDIPSLIETLSAGMMLRPGDVIATGTPAGVGLGLDPPQFLRPGDEVVVTIAGLGTLRNTFV